MAPPKLGGLGGIGGGNMAKAALAAKLVSFDFAHFNLIFFFPTYFMYKMLSFSRNTSCSSIINTQVTLDWDIM